MNTMTKRSLVVAGAVSLLLVGGIAIAHTFNHTPTNTLTGTSPINGASATLNGILADTEPKCKVGVIVQPQVSTTSSSSGFSNLATVISDGTGAYSFTNTGLAKGATRWYKTVTTGFVDGDPHVGEDTHICNNATSNVVSVTRNP